MSRQENKMRSDGPEFGEWAFRQWEFRQWEFRQ